LFPSSHTVLACKSTFYLHESTYFTTCLECLLCSRLGKADKTAPRCQKSAFCLFPFSLGRSRPVVVPSRPVVVPPWGGFGGGSVVDLGSIWGRCRVALASILPLMPIWARSGVDLGSFWLRPSLWARAGVDLGSIWLRYWLDLGSTSRRSGVSGFTQRWFLPAFFPELAAASR
jgi:hypothetical protein